MAQPEGQETLTIEVEYRLAHPPEKVWRALTEPALLARWLMPNDIRPEVGHRFTFQAAPTPGWDGVVCCEVSLAIKPEVLAYTWRGGSASVTGYGHALDTTVTWTLTRTPDNGTLLRLVHAGFTDRDGFAWEAMGRGWRGKPAAVAQLLENLA